MRHLLRRDRDGRHPYRKPAPAEAPVNGSQGPAGIRRRFEASGPPAELLQPRWEPMLRVHPDYLDAFFAAVHAWPGGATGYFRDMIDLDDAGLARVRARLLEPA